MDLRVRGRPHAAAGRAAWPARLLVGILLAAAAGLYIITRQQGSMLLHHTSSSHTECERRMWQAGMHPGASVYFQQRQQIYAGMAASLRAHPLQLGGVITQGLAQTDLFTILPDPSTGRLRPMPRLNALSVPVRAVVLPFSEAQAAARLHAAVLAHLAPAVPEGLLWPQNHSLYHATVLHASSHTAPVAASVEDVQLEAEAVQVVAAATCPIRAVLDQVVATSTGVVLACWQVLPGGGEPAQLRAALQATLPRPPPPEAQVIRQPAILHTTLARLLAPPAGSRQKDQAGVTTSSLAAAASRMTQELCGMVVELPRLLFVQEHHLLALALGGKVTIAADVPLSCKDRQAEQPL